MEEESGDRGEGSGLVSGGRGEGSGLVSGEMGEGSGPVSSESCRHRHNYNT